jgi:two-component system response regulator MprA
VLLAVGISMVSGVRVLVVDDDPDLLETVGDALTRWGAEVTRATNGAELIETLADRGPFDLVITDVAMPWMAGLQAIHAARTAGLGTPVIVMTALRDEGIPARVKALGGNAVLLHKPFALTELESVVSMLVTQHGREPEPGSGPDSDAHRVAS